MTKMLLLSTSMEAGRPRTSNRGDNNSYQNPREASSRPRIFLNSLEYLFVYLCHASWPNEKRYRPEIWYSYSHWSYLKTGFLFFSKKSPWLQLALKSCRVTWIFRIPPRLPCFLKFHFIQWNHWSLHSVFYKNVEDRFWEKIKNFCNITSSPKVLKWQKCDKNIVCYS